ncbi:hypothetical protein TrVE_jg11814 [Triparma verrucosa]|uniref:DUF6817 domain-containing protein n=1 Tax=Triparma verrucosa TaxID=1606542 RepID=A0A9W7EII2_9STRA|nr:hypothetical protein TrVE_jg11814 [Triparma verrucosa]
MASQPPKACPAVMTGADEPYLSLLRELVPDGVKHTGGPSFDEHLKGVMLVLRAWNCSKSVQLSGLFHSIYGTEGFQGHSIPFTRRSEIKKKIGDRAETLAYTFCVVDRLSVDESVKAEFESTGTRKLKARADLGGFGIELSDEEFHDFIELTLGDWLEQVESASLKENELFRWKVGQAWCYRRSAFKLMSRYLQREAEYDAVFAAEPEEWKGFEQFKTPPMSEKGREIEGKEGEAMKLLSEVRRML